MITLYPGFETNSNKELLVQMHVVEENFVVAFVFLFVKWHY